MSNDDRSRNTILDLGETLLNGLVGDEAGSRWRREVSEQLTDEDDIDYDTLLAAGVAAGEQVSRFRNQSRAAASQVTPQSTDQPSALVDVRDVYSPGGAYAGTRVTVSDPDAEAYLSASGSDLAVRSGDAAERVELPQQAAGIEQTTGADESVAEFVAYVEGSVVDPDAIRDAAAVTVEDPDADGEDDDE